MNKKTLPPEIDYEKVAKEVMRIQKEEKRQKAIAAESAPTRCRCDRYLPRWFFEEMDLGTGRGVLFCMACLYAYVLPEEGETKADWEARNDVEQENLRREDERKALLRGPS